MCFKITAMENIELIRKFYASFSSGDANGMISCYHTEVVFEDPAFGKLKGNRARNMWLMLLSRSQSKLTIEYSDIKVEGSEGFAKWKAQYYYGPKKRKVINNVQATFQFMDGNILHHTDHFSLWKWTMQALGISGFALGWSFFMKNKIQKSTNKMLAEFIIKKGEIIY